MKRLLEAVAISCLTAVSALSQSDVRVTGWYDGIAAGDGVTHGSGFKGVAIPSASPRWTKWLPPATPPNFYWQSHIVDDPSLTGSGSCQNGGPSYASNIIPLTSSDGETSLYLIGGNSLNANPLAPLIVDNG